MTASRIQQSGEKCLDVTGAEEEERVGAVLVVYVEGSRERAVRDDSPLMTRWMLRVHCSVLEDPPTPCHSLSDHSLWEKPAAMLCEPPSGESHVETSQE